MGFCMQIAAIYIKFAIHNNLGLQQVRLFHVKTVTKKICKLKSVKRQIHSKRNIYYSKKIVVGVSIVKIMSVGKDDFLFIISKKTKISITDTWKYDMILFSISI